MFDFDVVVGTGTHAYLISTYYAHMAASMNIQYIPICNMNVYGYVCMYVFIEQRESSGGCRDEVMETFTDYFQNIISSCW
jgi:hypothetical protein